MMTTPQNVWFECLSEIKEQHALSVSSEKWQYKFKRLRCSGPNTHELNGSNLYYSVNEYASLMWSTLALYPLWLEDLGTRLGA